MNKFSENNRIRIPVIVCLAKFLLQLAQNSCGNIASANHVTMETDALVRHYNSSVCETASLSGIQVTLVQLAVES